MKDIKIEILLAKVEELQELQNHLLKHYESIRANINQVQKIQQNSSKVLDKKIGLLQNAKLKVDNKDFIKEKNEMLEFMKSYQMPKASTPKWIYILTSILFIVTVSSMFYANLMNKRFTKVKNSQSEITVKQMNADFLEYMKVMKKQAPNTHQLLVDHSNELKKIDQSIK